MKADRPLFKKLTGAVAAALLTLTQAASADEVQAENVLRAVETWVQQVTADARLDALVEDLEPWLVDGEIVAHIARLEGGGFCLCGADDLVLPVYVYVPNGDFDPDSPTNLYILNEIAGRTAALRDTRRRGLSTPELQAQLADRAAYWRDLIAGQAPPSGAGTRSTPSQMVLPLRSTWDQGWPYNDDCPSLTPTEQTVTGCVATATAQVMYYWQWPPIGEGQTNMNFHIYFRLNWDSEPLATNPMIPQVWPWWPDRLRYNVATQRLEINGYWDNSAVNAAVQLAPNNSAYQTALGALFSRIGHLDQNHSVNHGATFYDFALMSDSVTGGDAASAAVATLMYHAGTACLMNWGILGSSTGSTEKVHALRDNFRYDADIVNGARDGNVITNDIQWFRPVTLSGSGPAGGHDWVVLGYNMATDPNRQYFMNFGWSGASNGWYTFDAVNTGNGGFNMNQWHVARIAPRNVVLFADTVGGGDGSPSSPYGSLNQALALAPNGTTLVFKAGSMNTYGSTITINRQLTLKGFEATLRP